MQTTLNPFSYPAKLFKIDGEIRKRTTEEIQEHQTSFQKILKNILDKDNEANKAKNSDWMNTSSKIYRLKKKEKESSI